MKSTNSLFPYKCNQNKENFSETGNQNKESNDMFSTTTTVFMNTNFVYSNGTKEPMEHFSIDLTDTQTLEVVGMLINNKQQQRDRLMNELSKL
jgi:hypothetical protein